MTLTAVATVVAASLVLGLGVPWVGIRMVWPSLVSKSGLTNYRGRPVHAGLGIVWLLWAGCAIIAGGLASIVLGETTGSALPLLMLAGPLALVAFALGIVDDAYGSGDSRGFRGHLAALGRGRLTTGGMKLLGVSLASLVVALVIGPLAPWGGPGRLHGSGVPGYVATALAAGAAIALTSNLVNLTDLRPGRALKSYSLLAILGVASTVLGLSGTAMLLDAAMLLVVLLGPVIAVWAFDLREQGMLGDAGANPMGAVAGMFIVVGLPLGLLVGYLFIVLALNLASERVSFTEVIEGNRVLRALDGLGRLPESAEIESPE